MQSRFLYSHLLKEEEEILFIKLARTIRLRTRSIGLSSENNKASSCICDKSFSVKVRLK